MAGLTAPIVAGAAVASNAYNKLNQELANTQSLGVSQSRLEAYRGTLQGMSIDVGKTTTDLTDGLYQVVSAYGDGADTMDALRLERDGWRC